MSLGVPIEVAHESFIEVVEKTISKGFQGAEIYHMNWIRGNTESSRFSANEAEKENY